MAALSSLGRSFVAVNPSRGLNSSLSSSLGGSLGGSLSGSLGGGV